MRERKTSMARSTLCILFIANLLATEIDALLCYCTEEECLSGDRSNMCVQEDPSLGCYKQYYSKMNPPITMGCVRFSLLCDSSRIRPGPYKSEWPNAACCFTDHCNRNLPLPPQNHTEIIEDTTTPPMEVISQSKSTLETVDSSQKEEIYTSAPESDTTVHPVFMLVMILIYIFLIVVMASVLVIVKVWFYRRKKSKPQKHWIIQRNMLHTKAQMSHLLTDEPYESAAICHQSNTSSIVSAFDVP